MHILLARSLLMSTLNIVCCVESHSVSHVLKLFSVGHKPIIKHFVDIFQRGSCEMHIAIIFVSNETCLIFFVEFAVMYVFRVKLVCNETTVCHYCVVRMLCGDTTV